MQHSESSNIIAVILQLQLQNINFTKVGSFFENLEIFHAFPRSTIRVNYPQVRRSLFKFTTNLERMEDAREFRSSSPQIQSAAIVIRARNDRGNEWCNAASHRY